MAKFVAAVYGKNHGMDLELILVDDRSTDGTPRVAWELGKKIHKSLRHERNLGKGAAIRTGLTAVSGDVVLVQDADLEYTPQDYPALLAPILNGRADAVYGSRFTGAERRALLFWHMVANKTLTLLCDLLTNLNLTDVWTGYKAFIYEQLKPRLGRRVVEIGAGVGNISRLLLDRDELALTDEDSSYVRQLENTYRDWGYVRVGRFDLPFGLLLYAVARRRPEAAA